MKHLSLLLLCCVAVPLLSCHAAGAAPASVMSNADGIWYRADQQLKAGVFGQTIKAPVGSLLDLSLAENASTGYSWRCSFKPAGTVTQVRSITTEPAVPMPGAGGTRHFLLLVNRAGKATITLQYGRWWPRGDRDPVKTFTIVGTP